MQKRGLNIDSLVLIFSFTMAQADATYSAFDFPDITDAGGRDHANVRRIRKHRIVLI
jgi:hypothetical protein